MAQTRRAGQVMTGPGRMVAPHAPGSCTVPVALLLAAVAVALVSWAPTARAEIKTKVLADGSRLYYNESPKQKARRTASRLLPVPRQDVEALIRYHANRQSLDPRLVQAVVQVESGYNPRARSVKGAMGLMQLMPETARDLKVSNPYDPGQNVRGGTQYLSWLVNRYGDLSLALAAYNAGPTRVDRYQGVPPFPETRNYIRKVLTLYRGSAPSQLLRDDAALRASRRAKSTAEQPSERAGSPVYLRRDANNRLLFTTEPPRP